MDLDRYREWAGREYSARARVGVLLVQFILFVVLIPVGILALGPGIDRALGLPAIRIGTVGRLFGAGFALLGLVLLGWSAYVQFARGRGTPAPMMPTQELVTDGPYRYSRNPLVAGGGMYLLGIALLGGTLSGVGFVLAFVLAQGVYIKTIEEKELADRFGDAYQEYKRDTPFLIPRP